MNLNSNLKNNIYLRYINYSMLKNIMIVGGTSGLWLELAKKYLALGHTIFVLGRHDPCISGLHYHHFIVDRHSDYLIQQIDTILSKLPCIHTVIYSAGYYQEWHIEQHEDWDIIDLVHTVMLAPMLIVKRLKTQTISLKVIFITSTSQFTPREYEPIYAASKAGLGMLGNSLSLDPEIGKVLVVAPGGMQTPFWKWYQRDISNFLDVNRVWDQIIILSTWPFKYKYAHIMRDPARVEVVETRS